MSDLLVGREAESAVLDAALHDALLVSAGVVVTGEAGIGKTSLLRAFAPRAREAGFLTVSCAGLPVGGRELPYAPVVQLLRELRRHHPARLDAALGPQASSVLAQVAPDVIPAQRSAVAAEHASPALEGSRLLTSLVGLVDALVNDGPIALLVDDLQWVDLPTLALLGALLRGSPASGLSIVATVRVPGVTGEVQRWCAIEGAAGNLFTVGLAPLTAPETARLLEAVSARPPSPALVSQVHGRSGGNPFLVRELARVAEGTVPESVQAVVRADVEDLPAAGRRVVAAVAVAGRAVEHQPLADVVGRDVAGVGAEAALTNGLLVLGADGYGFRHDLVRAAVTDLLLPAETRELHAALGAALARAVGDGDDARALAEVAWHLDEAADPRAMAHWALRAATAAERSGAFTAALRQLERVVAAAREIDLPEREQVAVLRRAAEAAHLAGDHSRALRHVDAALDLMSAEGYEPDQLVGVLAHRCAVLVALGDVPGADETARRAVRLSTGIRDDVRADLLATVAMSQGLSGQVEEARITSREALTVASRSGNPRVVARAAVQLGSWEPTTGPQEDAIALVADALHRARAVGDVDTLAHGGVSLTDRLLRIGRLEEAVRVADEARDGLATMAEGRHWLADMIVSNGCQAMIELGRWDEAMTLLDQSCVDDGWGTGRLARAGLRVALGDLDEAEADLQALSSLQRHDQPQFGLEYDENLAELRLWQRRPAAALEVVARVHAAVDDISWQERGRTLTVYALRASADLAEVSRRRRDAAGTESAVASGLAWGEVAAVVLAEAPGLRAVATAELARLTGDPDPALWATAATAWGDERPFPRAYARWREAEAMLDRGRSRSAADAPLQEAVSVARRLGAGCLLAELESLARRARIALREDSVPVHRVAAPGGLSPREMQVLRLLTDGRTNREIGEQLFMSPKTASVHVTHLLRKLGVTNRVQAASVAHRLGLADEVRAGYR